MRTPDRCSLHSLSQSSLHSLDYILSLSLSLIIDTAPEIEAKQTNGKQKNKEQNNKSFVCAIINTFVRPSKARASLYTNKYKNPYCYVVITHYCLTTCCSWHRQLCFPLPLSLSCSPPFRTTIKILARSKIARLLVRPLSVFLIRKRAREKSSRFAPPLWPTTQISPLGSVLRILTCFRRDCYLERCGCRAWRIKRADCISAPSSPI